MTARRRSRIPQEPFETRIQSLTHAGLGEGWVGERRVLVHGALDGERVMFRYRKRHRLGDEGIAESVIEPSPLRVPARCAHFALCSGCALQHLGHAAQINYKQAHLCALLDGQRLTPDRWLPPLTGPLWGYRHKARLGVKYVRNKGRVLVGFRERASSLVADLHRCEVLHPAVGGRLGDLAALVQSMDARESIPQLEVAVGDGCPALVVRHLEPLSEADRARLREHGAGAGLRFYLQPKGPGSVEPLEPDDPPDLSYALPEEGLTLRFAPTDFTQVNFALNRKMVAQAMALLDPGRDETVLDLFCGLGNFTLPIARRAARVVGLEGEAGLVARAAENAARNGVHNATFRTADLAAGLPEPIAGQRFDKVLLDPPRSGANGVLEDLAGVGARRVVYVACGPEALARDLAVLVHGHGYRIEAAGLMDMFPHTAHFESMAVLERP